MRDHIRLKAASIHRSQQRCSAGVFPPLFFKPLQQLIGRVNKPLQLQHSQPWIHVSPHPLRALTPWNDRAAVDATAAVDVAQQTRFSRDRPRAPTGRRLAHESCCWRDAGLHLFSRATAHRNGWRHGARRDGTVPRCGTAAPTRQASSGPSTR